uniref:ER membrane protein complex subunit 2 n=1 Tax=Sinocyclocheilus rhinocerous TaxID=307959 RepID=A0A673LBE6_9TELE
IYLNADFFFIKFLLWWREENYRNSEQIVDVGEELINEHASKLGDDSKYIYKCLENQFTETVWKMFTCCLQELKRQFPDSHRVKRLAGMRLEALERYEDANKLYDSMLQDDPTNTAARKRKISILRAQGKSSEAIRELNEYLEQFVGDQEAWHELSELYINEHDFKCAYNTTSPFCFLYNLPQVKYTQGGLENLELARKYFAQALKLNNRNMRALFGLYMVSSTVTKGGGSLQRVNLKSDIFAWGIYMAGRGKKENKCSVKAVEEMLESMQITMS